VETSGELAPIAGYMYLAGIASGRLSAESPIVSEWPLLSNSTLRGVGSPPYTAPDGTYWVPLSTNNPNDPTEFRWTLVLGENPNAGGPNIVDALTSGVTTLWNGFEGSFAIAISGGQRTSDGFANNPLNLPDDFRRFLEMNGPMNAAIAEWSGLGELMNDDTGVADLIAAIQLLSIISTGTGGAASLVSAASGLTTSSSASLIAQVARDLARGTTESVARARTALARWMDELRLIGVIDEFGVPIRDAGAIQLPMTDKAWKRELNKILSDPSSLTSWSADDLKRLESYLPTPNGQQALASIQRNFGGPKFDELIKGLESRAAIKPGSFDPIPDAPLPPPTLPFHAHFTVGKVETSENGIVLSGAHTDASLAALIKAEPRINTVRTTNPSPGSAITIHELTVDGKRTLKTTFATMQDAELFVSQYEAWKGSVVNGSNRIDRTRPFRYTDSRGVTVQITGQILVSRSKIDTVIVNL
jgi:hypothetical protein